MLEDRNASNGLANSSPVAADDWFDLLHDTTLFANLLWNDYDPDGDTLSITRINGQTYTPGTQIALHNGDLIYGYLTVGQDGSFTFTPTLRYKGQVSFSYTISDGEYQSTAWVTINVFNNMPQLGDQEFSMLHDRDLMGNLLSGAYDPDGDAIRITHINGQAISYGEPMSLPSGGSLTVWADGTFSYTPPPNFTGTDSFSLTISDDLDSYTAMVNILITNNAPYAYDASFSVLHDRELTGQLYGYDLDGDPITAQLVSGPANGTLTLNPDGTFTYTPNTHYVGPDSFIYQWSDSVAVGNLAEVRITVLNNAPTVEIDYEEYGFSGNTLYVGPPGILSHVYDPDGDSMEPIIVASTTQGSLQVYPDGGFVYNIPDSYWDYHQDSIFVQDSFRITYKDVVGAQSVTEKLVSLMSGPFVPPGSSDEGNQNAANPPPDVATAIRNRAGGVQLVNTYWVAILAREPDPQGGALRRGGDTGHTFIAAVDFGNNPQQPNTITIMGFGPAGQYNWWDALNNRVVRGIVADNSRHRWTIGAAWQINQQQYQAVINRFNRDANNPPNYSVFDYNCTNWAFDVLNRETHIGWRPQLVQERVTGRWLLAPAQLGVELRRNPVPQNGIRLEP